MILTISVVLVLFTMPAMADKLLPSQTKPDELTIRICQDDIVLGNVVDALQQRLNTKVEISNDVRLLTAMINKEGNSVQCGAALRANDKIDEISYYLTTMTSKDKAYVIEIVGERVNPKILRVMMKK